MNYPEQVRLQIVNRFLVACVTILISAILIFGGRGLYSANAARAANAEVKEGKVRLAGLQSDLARLNTAKSVKAPESNEAVISVQRTAQSAAKENKVQVEFDSVQDPQIYITRYAADTDAPDWKMIDMQMTMHGSFRAIHKVLDTFRASPVFFEFGPIDIVREQPARDGTSSVRATVSLRILFQE